MSEAAAPAILSAHTNTELVTRETLRALPAVIGTDSFKPVAHIELIETFERQFNDRGINIVREQFALSKNGMRLFGTFDLTLNGVEGMAAALGFRTANNRTMALQGIAGMRVFVCDNMAFSGQTIVLRRKHTSGLNLLDEIVEALDQYEIHYKKLKLEIGSLQNCFLDDIKSKVLLHDIFAKQIMPVRYFPSVSDVYFNQYVNSEEPKYAAFRERTAWNLLNAFTEVAKEMPLTTRIDATQEIGAIFGTLVK
jgi:Domain of unknown function (DUF932)